MEGTVINDPKEGDLVKITYGTHADKFGRITGVVNLNRYMHVTLVYVIVKGVRELVLYPEDMEPIAKMIEEGEF